MKTGYVLIWNIKDFHANGGGLDWTVVDCKQEGLKLINSLNKEWENKFELLHFGLCNSVEEVVKEEVVTKYKLKFSSNLF